MELPVLQIQGRQGIRDERQTISTFNKKNRSRSRSPPKEAVDKSPVRRNQGTSKLNIVKSRDERPVVDDRNYEKRQKRHGKGKNYGDKQE